MEFLTLKQVELNKANYLVSKESKKPVNHAAFVEQQNKAHYIILLAEAIKGKTFKVGKLDNLDAIKAAVKASMTNDTRSYVEAPKQPQSKVNDEMVEFALNFAKFEDEKDKVAQVNEFMQQFNAVQDVQEVGDYFSEGVVKVAKLYTIEQILAAVQTNIDVLS
jgi:hypothetical protein